jgi:anthranilate/para-aminobenzoate synthase component II
MILLIDNYDSFTWNLYQYFCELGAEVVVRRNDEMTWPISSAGSAENRDLAGPCTPSESGISLEVIRTMPASCRSWAFAWAIRRLPRRLARPSCAPPK